MRWAALAICLALCGCAGVGRVVTTPGAKVSCHFKPWSCRAFPTDLHKDHAPGFRLVPDP